jgi:formiminotetrahydrofolate cyclodeaminase
MTDAVPNYAELPLGRFVDMVASREPTPGGGASAAVAVALAAALTAMAARFSADHLADAETIADRAEELRNRVMPLAQADAAAYGRVLDAYRTPRDDEKRRRRIREALSEAADVPLSIAEVGVEVAGNAARLVEEGNPNLRGDAVTAAALAKAGVRAAATLVEINVSAGGADDDRLSRVDQLLATMAAAQEVVEGTEARSRGKTWVPAS